MSATLGPRAQVTTITPSTSFTSFLSLRCQQYPKPINSHFLLLHFCTRGHQVGGDGTLLHASHFMDESIPVLGVNSDPTKTEEVKNLVMSLMLLEAPAIYVLQQ